MSERHGAAATADDTGMESMAGSATLHCLTGCASGELVGISIATAIGLPTLASIPIAFGLSFVFGYSLSAVPLLKGGLAVGTAFKLVLAADTLSILTMEIVDNAVAAVIPGALNAGLLNPTFWWSLGLAFVLAYAAAYPVNRALLKRGRGHAVTHGAADGADDPDDWRTRLPDPSPRQLALALAAVVAAGLAVSLVFG